MKKLSVYQMTTCALMTALMCILGPLSVPIGPVPVSLTILVILITVIILDTGLALISYVLYLLLGIAGLPVFSGYQGGVAKLAGPTGGYLIGFIFLILISGICYNKFHGKSLPSGICMFIAVLVDYVFGTAWFVISMKCGIWYALTVCVFPFIPFDIVKIILALFVGKAIRSALAKAGLLKK